MRSSSPTQTTEQVGMVTAWTAVGLLWFAGGSNYLTRTMLTTMHGSIVEDIPMTEAQFGLLTTGFLLCYAFVSPFGGFLADRFSRRHVVVWSLVTWSSLTWLTSYVTTFEHFLILRSLLGLSQAFYIPAAVAMIVDYHRGPTRALATGVHLTGMIVGAVIGGVGGWLAERDGWSYAYSVISLPNLALGVVLFLFLRDAPREVHAQSLTADMPKAISLGDAFRSLIKPGPFYYVAGCLGIQGGVSWIIIAWMPTLMREQFQMAQGTAGFSALGCLYLAQSTGLLTGGFWSDRLSVRNPRARILIPAVAILLTTPAFLLTGWFHHIGFTVACLALWGLAMGFLGANTMPIVCLVVDARFRSTAMGILNCFTSICGGLSIYGVGAMRDAKLGISSIMAFAAIGVFVCGALLWLANRAVKRQAAPVAAA